MLRDLGILAICAALTFSGGWAVNGWRKGKEIAEMKADYETKRGEAESSARSKERSLQEAADKIKKEAYAENANINRKLNNALAGLRSRAERPSPSSVPSPAGACSGSTGAELARGDGEFLAGYAADAARLNEALNQCISQYNLRAKLP